ncbi:unnamed protein product [Dovyalis caffra]|uniref:Uncharacterized protein n=1 Tax=Dovyalis caffra TaxID=77055 RepID=A0AAV1SAJ2_9ROSI|nr:unnamed protein product [Dovyalis caffra]
MVITNFSGTGVGFGFGVGCGFGVGWGFGGMPMNILGLGAGAGCGVGLGLGWGFGAAFGSQYRSSTVTFQGMELAKKEEISEPHYSAQCNTEIVYAKDSLYGYERNAISPFPWVYGNGTVTSSGRRHKVLISMQPPSWRSGKQVYLEVGIEVLNSPSLDK